MKSFLMAVVAIPTLGLLFYGVWTETGVYAWWAEALSGGGGYSKTLVFLATMLTLFVPLSVLGWLLGFRNDPSASNGPAGTVFVVSAVLLIAGSLVHLGCSPPLQWNGSFKAFFSQAGWFPREFTAPTRALPPMDHRFDVAIATKRHGQVESTDVYVPLDESCWPERRMPVVLLTTPDRLRNFYQTDRKVFTLVKQPVPFLVRKSWKAEWVTDAIVVRDQGVILGFWLYIWLFALLLLLSGVQHRKAAGKKAGPTRWQRLRPGRVP